MDQGKMQEESLSEKSFLADLTGLYAQHSSMWSVYTDSIKILVSITSLPILVAAVVLSVTKDASSINFGRLPDVLYWTLLILPALDLLLLGVVIHYRQVILFYARGLNGYRRIYLAHWNAERNANRKDSIDLPMPIDPNYPPRYEFLGPMGLVVHCSGIVNGLYIFGATQRHFEMLYSAGLGLFVLLIYESWYLMSCRPSEPKP